MKPGPEPATPNAAEFDALYERHSREVWALGYARWLNADAALDIAQEAFMRLWKEWGRGETIHNPRAWLLRVARNLAEDYAKSAFRRNGTQPPQTMATVHSKQDGPLDQLMERERLDMVGQLLREMPEADREILTLRYALDYSSAQIAETLGINPAAVHMRLSRARHRLAQRLTAHGVIADDE